MYEELKRLGIDDKYNAYYDAEIVHKKEMNSARYEGRREGMQAGKKENQLYNVPINVDTIRRRYPIKWTYQEGIKSLIVDTKIWIF